MDKTIKISDENYAKLFKLVNDKRRENLKARKYEDVSFNDIITELLKGGREQ